MEEDFCGLCQQEQDYSTCYCCTICWRLFCGDCIYIFDNMTLYTICLHNECIGIHQLLRTYFPNDIAMLIADKLN